MKYGILIPILATVLVAGCVIPGIPEIPTGPTVQGGRGLEITSFTAEPSSVYSGAKVRITMETENQGGTTIPKDKALVYLTGSNMDFTSGSDMYWRASGSCTGTATNCSDLDETACGGQLGCTWNDTSSACEGTATKCSDLSGTECSSQAGCTWTSSITAYQTFSKDMKPADAVKGTPADTKRFTWSLIAPTVATGQTRTDTFYGRTYCDYSTGVNGNIWVYTEGEADAARASGRPLNKATFTSTTGPVGLEVKVSPDPVVYYGSGETFSLYITVSNLATGTIYKKGKSYSSGLPSITADDYNQVYVDVIYDTGKLTLTNSADCESYQELPAGKSTTLVCDFTVSTPPTTFQSYPITITADYGYYTERSTTVTVQGK